MRLSVRDRLAASDDGPGELAAECASEPRLQAIEQLFRDERLAYLRELQRRLAKLNEIDDEDKGRRAKFGYLTHLCSGRSLTEPDEKPFIQSLGRGQETGPSG
jgi:hypothetical protein